MGRVASRSRAFVAYAGCAFGAAAVTPAASTKVLSGSRGSPVSFAVGVRVGVDDGDAVAAAVGLAFTGAALAVLSAEAASRSALATCGRAAAPAMKSAKEV